MGGIEWGTKASSRRESQMANKLGRGCASPKTEQTGGGHYRDNGTHLCDWEQAKPSCVLAIYYVARGLQAFWVPFTKAMQPAAKESCCGFYEVAELCARAGLGGIMLILFCSLVCQVVISKGIHTTWPCWHKSWKKTWLICHSYFCGARLIMHSSSPMISSFVALDDVNFVSALQPFYLPLQERTF